MEATTGSRRFSRFLRAVPFLFLLNSVFSWADQPLEGLKDTIRHFEKAQGSTDPEGDLERIRSLRGQAFQEVQVLAKRQIILESHASVLNVERLIAWVEVLGSISDSSEIRLVGWLKKEVLKAYSNHPDIRELTGFLDQTLELLRKNPRVGELPRIREVEGAARASLIVRKNSGIPDDRLIRFVEALNSDKFTQFNSATAQALTPDIRASQERNRFVPVLARDAEIDSAIDVLLRMKGKAPVILGEMGVGKSAVVEGIAAKLLTGEIPHGVHSARLKNSIVLVTNPAKIASLVDDPGPRAVSMALNWYFNQAKAIGRLTQTNVIVVIDQAHQLVGAQVDTLKALLDEGTHSMILVGGAKQASFTLMADEQFVSRIEPIMVQELDETATFQLIKSSALPEIQRNYQLVIPDEVVTAAIELSAELQPDLRRPDAPIKLLQDAAIYVSRTSNGEAGSVTLSGLYQLAARKARLPVVSQDRQRFIEVMDEVKLRIKRDVRGQDVVVDKIVNLFAATMTAKGRKTRAAVIVGTTGTGKSLIPTRLTHYFYGSQTRMLKIDGNQLKTDDSGFYLFGPKSGYIGSDKNKGLLANHFDGPGKGSSIVLVDELDKMHPQQVERLMEIIDTGKFIAGDGKIRSTGRVLWLFTSNKGATKFFPPEFVKTATIEEVQKRLLAIPESEVREAFTQQESFAKSDEVLKPEVLARMDEMILVAPILKETALEIARIKIRDEVEGYRQQGLGTLRVDDGFAKAIVNESYDPVFGVRELERNVRTKIGEIYDALVKQSGASREVVIETLMPGPGSSIIRFKARNERGDELLVNGPKLAFENPLFDPAEKANLRNLETALNSRVFGQTFYAKKLAESIQKSVVDAGSNKPVSIYALGMTGNGKTEMARALTMARFGSLEHLCKLEMGQVGSTKDLSNIFQSSVGYVGSDQPGQFERFLQTHKRGVILFDEMGNAGGNDKNAKEEIGKYLYSILDDGIWVSPVTKKTYLLRDYVFIFTGNEAERIFAGNSQDDLLRAIWKDYSSEEKARELLRQSGLSPAFVGRIGSVVLTEPPVKETKESIVRKLLGEWIKRVEAKQPVRILHDGNFVELLSKLTYSASEGARSVINFVNTTLGSAASKGVFEVDFSKASLDRRAEVRLSLEVKIPSHPFYSVVPDETLAKLIVTVVQEGVEIAKIESDFTKAAHFIKQIRMVDAYATAFHEAGHAILNDPASSGRVLQHLTIIPADHYLGYARYEDLPGFKTNYTLTDLRARLATLVAGSEAELLIGREVNSGQAGDLKEERRLLTRAATTWGLVPELMGAKVDDNGIPAFTGRQFQIFEAFAERELKVARETAKKFIQDNWVLEYKVAEELMNRGEISGARFQEIKNAVQKMGPSEVKSFLKLNPPEKVRAMLAHLDKETCADLLKRASRSVD
ncbi:MAG: AAA family ATPase [Bdellovibrionales bacterium]|nr:AAA family ATPase [Bdellovibrionales bacterium]